MTDSFADLVHRVDCVECGGYSEPPNDPARTDIPVISVHREGCPAAEDC